MKIIVWGILFVAIAIIAIIRGVSKLLKQRK